MTAKEKINKIWNELFPDETIKNEQVKLDDGRVVEFESFEVGQTISVVNEDGSLTPLEDGDFTKEDGIKFSVKDGLIVSIEETVETPEEPVVEEKVSNEIENRLKAIEDRLEKLENPSNEENEKIIDLVEKLNLNLQKVENKVKIMEKQPIVDLVKTKTPEKITNEVKPSWYKKLEK